MVKKFIKRLDLIDMLNKGFKEVFNDIVTAVIKYKSLLVLLIITDFMFVVLHSFYVHDFLDGNKYYSLATERGYSEFYQYIKEFWVFLLLIHISFKKKQFIYFLWSFLFLYFLLDDSIGFHENYGNYLAELFEFQSMFNLRPIDLGEFLVSLCIGAIFLMAFLFSYYKADLIGKKITRTISILIVMLVFFGVFIDLLHIAVAYQNNRWTIVEDSGEMFVMSLILCYAFHLNKEVITK